MAPKAAVRHFSVVVLLVLALASILTWPDPGLVDAVNVALVLNKPLQLTGDPGTGPSPPDPCAGGSKPTVGSTSRDTSRSAFQRFDISASSTQSDWTLRSCL